MILTRNFAVQRVESCLSGDLVLMKQLPNEKPQFYDKILKFLNLLCQLSRSKRYCKRIKEILYQNFALKTFLSGLTEPLGTTIHNMKPTSLGQAIQFVIQEDKFSNM